MTSPTPPASPLATSFVRTFTPAIAAALVSLLLRAKTEVDTESLNGFIELALFGAFYAVPRLLEDKVDGRFGWLLGKASAPKYVDQAGLEQMGQDAFAEKLNAPGAFGPTIMGEGVSFGTVPQTVNVFLKGDDPDRARAEGYTEGYWFVLRNLSDPGVQADLLTMSEEDAVAEAVAPPTSRAARVRRTKVPAPKKDW